MLAADSRETEALAHQEAHVSAVVAANEESVAGPTGLPIFGQLGTLHAKVRAE